MQNPKITVTEADYSKEQKNSAFLTKTASIRLPYSPGWEGQGLALTYQTQRPNEGLLIFQSNIYKLTYKAPTPPPPTYPDGQWYPQWGLFQNWPYPLPYSFLGKKYEEIHRAVIDGEGTYINIHDVNPFLTEGQEIYSPNGKAKLVLQGDGNLVLYHVDNGIQEALWSSETVGSGAKTVYWQSDVNIVAYKGFNGAAAQAAWDSHIFDSDGSIYVRYSYLGVKERPILKLQNDGNLVMYWPMFTNYGEQFYIVTASTETDGFRQSGHYGNMNPTVVPSGYGRIFTQIDLHTFNRQPR